MFMMYFIQNYLTNIFSRYCGHFQGKIITRIQTYYEVSRVAVTP